MGRAVAEAARAVGRLVELLRDEALAKEHVEVILVGVGAVAVDGGGGAAPARVAGGDPLEIQRVVEGCVRKDPVRDVRSCPK